MRKRATEVDGEKEVPNEETEDKDAEVADVKEVEDEVPEERNKKNFTKERCRAKERNVRAQARKAHHPLVLHLLKAHPR
ncbi:hypothetical protein Tco_0845635 [Tanacetum coccineum]